MELRQISPKDLADNPFQRIGTDWMLVCAGSMEKHNAMTASWGQMGILWNRPVATVYVRPQRYTHQFVEDGTHFSLSFFAPGTNRAQLELMGSKSGRDGDKVAEAGLAVAQLDGIPYFADAELVLLCRKLYRQDMQPAAFLDETVCVANYPQGDDFHTMYVGEIEGMYRREG